MKRAKYSEANIPAGLIVSIRYQRGTQFVTACRLVHKETKEIVAAAHAICSLKEQPSKKIGRAIAIGRALKLYHAGVSYHE